MANPADARTLALALEEKLGVHPGEAFEGLLVVTFTDGRRSEARFRSNNRDVLVSAPVANAHDGLPAAILRDLLARNAPGGDLSGGTLRVRPNQDRLEIADLLPLALGADVIANIMINQVNAAATLSHWIAERTAEAA